MAYHPLCHSAARSSSCADGFSAHLAPSTPCPPSKSHRLRRWWSMDPSSAVRTSKSSGQSDGCEMTRATTSTVRPTGRCRTCRKLERTGFDKRSPHGSVALSSPEKPGSRRFAPRFTVNDIGHRNEITRIHFFQLPNHINVLGRRIQGKISFSVNQQSTGTKPIKSPRSFRVAGIDPCRDLTQAPALFRAGPNEKQGFDLRHGSDVFYDEFPNFIGDVGLWHTWTAGRDRGGFPEAR